MLILNILVFNFLIVLVTELSVSFLLGIRTIREAITVILINIITNPIVVVLSLLLTFMFYEWRVFGNFILEIAVVFSEGYMFGRFNIFNNKNTYLCALLLNTISFLAGELLKLIY